MSASPSPDTRAIGRRGLLFGAGALGAGAALAGVHEQQHVVGRRVPAAPASPAAAPAATTTPGKAVTIGFSAPEADHGWIGAITTNAKDQAGKYSDVTLQAVEGTNDVNQQISQVETLINKKVDAHRHPALRRQGPHPDRASRRWRPASPSSTWTASSPARRGSRAWIGGDNYGMGAAAGTYIGQQLKAKGVTNPVIAEIQGIANLPLTQDRSQGLRGRARPCGSR